MDSQTQFEQDFTQKRSNSVSYQQRNSDQTLLSRLSIHSPQSQCFYQRKLQNEPIIFEQEQKQVKLVQNEQKIEFQELNDNQIIREVQNLNINENEELKSDSPIKVKIINNQLIQSKFTCLDYDESFKERCGCDPIFGSIKKCDSKFAFLGKLDDDEICEIFFKIIKIFATPKNEFYLLPKDLEVVQNICKQYYIENNIPQQEQFFNFQTLDLIKHELIIDIMVVIGGDGTILYTLSHFQNKESPPIIAFEKGTLGFMSMYSLTNLEEDMKNFKKLIENHQKVRIEQKMRLKGYLYDPIKKEKKKDPKTGKDIVYHALNEFCLDRGQANILKLDIYINNIFLTQFWGDGVIFSTPTGSTAYNMSAGGPISLNEVGSIIMTSLAPFSLSFRPIVWPQCSQITLKVSSDSRTDCRISGDSQFSTFLKKDEEFIIHSSEFPAIIVRETNGDYFQEWVDKLKQLLNWNNTSIEKSMNKKKHNK